MDREVYPASVLNGKLDLPPDKSISHRSVMFAALHNGKSLISNFSTAADPLSTLSCLRQLGVEIKRNGNSVEVEGTGRKGFIKPEDDLYCGNSGTTMRLLSGLVGGAGISCTLTGDDSLSGRTMKRIIDPLNKMGIKIDARENNFAPLQISRNTPLSGMKFELPIPSAQLKSCVLLAGLFGETSTEVIEKIPSRDHTERLLELPVRQFDEKKIISSSKEHLIPEQSYTVPNDFSAAAFWLAAGSIHPNASINLESVGINPTRTGALNLLRRMGAEIDIDNKRQEGREPVADLKVQSSNLKAVTVNDKIVPNCIDEIPILAVAMLFAEGRSVINGAEELRHKETDRLSALADMLKKAGARFRELPDGFEIYGHPDFTPEAASYHSFHDHRIAMAGAVLALMAEKNSLIRDSECTTISYPDFWEHLNRLTN